MITNSPDWDYHTLGAQADECDDCGDCGNCDDACDPDD